MGSEMCIRDSTGHDRLPEILKGINILQDLNFENIKINAVLLNGINASDKDFEAWSKFIKENKVDFRYIELMQTGENLDYLNSNNLKINFLYRKLDQYSWQYCNKGFFNFKNYIPKIISTFN